MAIYVRVNPRSQLESRYRAGLEFGADWTAIDVDAADRAAIEQDPYLEVSESAPTEIEAVAVETELSPATSADGNSYNYQSGQAPEGFEWVLKPNLDDVSADLLNNPPSENADGALAQEVGAESATVDSSGDAPAVVDAVIAEAAPIDLVEAVAAPADQPQADELYQAVKAAVATLDKDIPANWLKDGRPATRPLEEIIGKTVSSGLRDLVWADIRTEAGE